MCQENVTWIEIGENRSWFIESRMYENFPLRKMQDYILRYTDMRSGVVFLEDHTVMIVLIRSDISKYGRPKKNICKKIPKHRESEKTKDSHMIGNYTFFQCLKILGCIYI